MDGIRVVKKPIGREELVLVASEGFGDMVKAVVDVERCIMAIGGELHADEEALLLDEGSRQEKLWGVNIYVHQPRDEWIEYDSMINIRPSHGNRSRNIEDEAIRQEIKKIVNSLLV